MDIKLGQAAKDVREKLGLSQREAADALGITNVHLSNIENDKASPSVTLLDRYREQFGVDLYVFAWCGYGNLDGLPAELQSVASKLSKLWSRQLEQLARE